MTPLPNLFSLGLADAEYFGTARRAFTLCSRAAVFHGNRFGVLDFYLFPALDTICLHFHLLNGKHLA